MDIFRGGRFGRGKPRSELTQSSGHHFSWAPLSVVSFISTYKTDERFTENRYLSYLCNGPYLQDTKFILPCYRPKYSRASLISRVASGPAATARYLLGAGWLRCSLCVAIRLHGAQIGPRQPCRVRPRKDYVPRQWQLRNSHSISWPGRVFLPPLVLPPVDKWAGIMDTAWYYRPPATSRGGRLWAVLDREGCKKAGCRSF